MTSTDQTQSSYHVKPVGVVRSSIKTPGVASDDEEMTPAERMRRIREQHHQIKTLISEVEVFEEYEDALDGLADFSHIMILYWPHLVPEERRNIRQVHPMAREDIPLKGVFATCSPARPNPVLVSTIRLLDRSGRVLRVQGLEAVDGSPVLDIKPFVQMAHGAENPTRPDWMQQLHRALEEGSSGV